MTTEEEIKTKCAELDGWIYNEASSESEDLDYWLKLETRERVYMEDLPDYTGSYDAIIPLIQKQSTAVRERMVIELGKEAGWNDEPKEWVVSIMRTPMQYCEALLRAVLTGHK